jgi:hypothetical protein
MRHDLAALKSPSNSVPGVKRSHQGVTLRLHQSLETLLQVRHTICRLPPADVDLGGAGTDGQPSGPGDGKLMDALQKLRIAEQQLEAQKAHELSLQNELRAIHSKCSALEPQAETGLRQHILEIHRGQQLHMQSLSDIQEENRALHHELLALRQSQQTLWAAPRQRDSRRVIQTWSVSSVAPDTFWRGESCEKADRSAQTDGSEDSLTELDELARKCSGTRNPVAVQCSFDRFVK